MLYGYPIAATAENWLHDCLGEMLRSIHASLQVGKSPQLWPNILPAAYRSKLRRRRGLQEKLDAYQKAVEVLSPLRGTKSSKHLMTKTKLLFCYVVRITVLRLMTCLY